jgi:hypothetical protein
MRHHPCTCFTWITNWISIRSADFTFTYPRLRAPHPARRGARVGFDRRRRRRRAYPCSCIRSIASIHVVAGRIDRSDMASLRSSPTTASAYACVALASYAGPVVRTTPRCSRLINRRATCLCPRKRKRKPNLVSGRPFASPPFSLQYSPRDLDPPARS